MTVAKRLAHGGVLAFTAFWLIATSRPQEPAVECFVPLRSRSLEVTLGARLPPGPGAAPSCREIDGLKEGSVSRVELTRTVKPPEVGGGSDVCWSYAPAKLSGPAGVSGVHADEPHRFQPTTFFEARGAFERPGPECAGDFRLSFYADAPFRVGMRADPLRAGVGERWLVRRLVSVEPGGPCSFKFPDNYCEDTFEVSRVAPAR